MEITEMMKRYEEKMDLKKDSIKMQYVYDRFIEGFEEFVQEEYDALQSENTRLKAQLTWRPVSEKPEKDGKYYVMYGDNQTTAEYGVGLDEWTCEVINFGSIYVTHRPPKYWLPIPPAPDTLPDGWEEKA